jgi:hypothetical protein
MSLRQRDPRQHDEAHLAFVRTRQCCIPYCKRQAEAAHIRMGCRAIGKEPTGMAEKPHDKWTCPLCPYHHRIGAGSQHSMCEADFWALMGLNPFAIAAELWIASGGAEREAAPPRVKQPRKIKARKPVERRKKVPAGRPLQSNPTIQSRGFPKRPAPRASVEVGS